MDTETLRGSWGFRVEIPLRAVLGQLWDEAPIRRGELRVDSLECQGQQPGLYAMVIFHRKS